MKNNPFESYHAFGHISVESQPQNPEFRNNPENFHPCSFLVSDMRNLCKTTHLKVTMHLGLFLWKVSLKILNSGIILKTFTHVVYLF